MLKWIAAVLAGFAGVVLLVVPAGARSENRRSYFPTSSEWPRPEVLQAALRAYQCGRSEGHFDAPLLTIIDYSLPSTQRRLWVIDLARKRVLFHELVAHGKNSGEERSASFSDAPGSLMSSIGLFRTAEVYRGKHGMSLRLDGLEPGINGRARERAIVVHGASYVSERSLSKLNQLGRSWGCPAVSIESHQKIINLIQGGTALFAYYPDANWLQRSEFLHCPATTQVARNTYR